MAAPNLASILRLRGRIVKNPANLALAYPFGGTELGLTRAAVFRYGVVTRAITAEEFGGRKTNEVYCYEAGILAAVLRDYDKDYIQTVFPSSGFGTGPIITQNQTTEGILLDSKAVKILFVPIGADDVPVTTSPWIILYKAMPILDASAELQLSAGQEAGIATVWEPIPDDAGRVYQIAVKADLLL